MTTLTLIGRRLELALDEEYRRMQNEWFFKWHFIGGETPVEIESFSGNPIIYCGLSFFGTTRDVYWHTIQLYLRKKIVSILNELEHELPPYSRKIRSKSLDEAGPIIRRFAARIRQAAIEKDRILRGNGVDFPSANDCGEWQGSHTGDIDGGIQALRNSFCRPSLVVGGYQLPFQDMLNDVVSLVKRDGTVSREGIAASVQSRRIIIFDDSLPIEAGDHLLRRLPNGLVEDYIVEDPHFIQGLDEIDSHFQVYVRRSGASTAPASTIINNIHGYNARIAINSTDNSSNDYSTSISALFDAATSAASKIENDKDRESITDLLNKMKSSNEKKDGEFNELYLKFMAIASDHLGVLGPFIPALSKMLGVG